MRERPTVMVADDHPSIHPLVREILSGEFDVLDPVYDGEELVEAVPRLSPCVVVVDIAMPRLNGIEAVRRLNRTPRPAIVFLTTHTDPLIVREALSTGVRAVVSKASAAEELIPAIRAALENRDFISPAIVLP